MIAMSAPQPNGRHRASPLQVVKTVLSGFFGVGRRAHHDAVKLTPVQIILTGLIAAAIFVGTLLFLVNFILSRVGAGA
jgi:hypothetical protein